MKVRIKSSPYRDIKRKDVGVVTLKQFVGTVQEVWRVQVKDTSRLFSPNEVGVLNNEEV